MSDHACAVMQQKSLAPGRKIVRISKGHTGIWSAWTVYGFVALDSISFCPFCGQKLEEQLEHEHKDD